MHKFEFFACKSLTALMQLQNKEAMFMLRKNVLSLLHYLRLKMIMSVFSTIRKKILEYRVKKNKNIFLFVHLATKVENKIKENLS